MLTTPTSTRAECQEASVYNSISSSSGQTFSDGQMGKWKDGWVDGWTQEQIKWTLDREGFDLASSNECSRGLKPKPGACQKFTKLLHIVFLCYEHFGKMATLMNVCSGINRKIQRPSITEHRARSQVTLREGPTPRALATPSSPGNSVTINEKKDHGQSWTVATYILLNTPPPSTVITVQEGCLWVRSLSLTHASVFSNLCK